MSHVFCTDLSREAGDPLPGSGAHAERNLLISWPRARWQRNLRHASDMPPELAAQLDALAASGRRVNLIHRRDQPAEVHEVILMPERRRLQLERSALVAFVLSVSGASSDRITAMATSTTTWGRDSGSWFWKMAWLDWKRLLETQSRASSVGSW